MKKTPPIFFKGFQKPNNNNPGNEIVKNNLPYLFSHVLCSRCIYRSIQEP